LIRPACFVFFSGRKRWTWWHSLCESIYKSSFCPSYVHAIFYARCQ